MHRAELGGATVMMLWWVPNQRDMMGFWWILMGFYFEEYVYTIWLSLVMTDSSPWKIHRILMDFDDDQKFGAKNPSMDWFSCG